MPVIARDPETGVPLYAPGTEPDAGCFLDSLSKDHECFKLLHTIIRVRDASRAKPTVSAEAS